MIEHYLTWYAQTAPGIIEARVRTYLKGKAISEEAYAGIPDDHPLPVNVPEEKRVAGITDAALQATAVADKRTTWDQNDVRAALETFLGEPVIWGAPPELVARERQAREEAAAREAVVTPSREERITDLQSQLTQLQAELQAVEEEA